MTRITCRTDGDQKQPGAYLSFHGQSVHNFTFIGANREQRRRQCGQDVTQAGWNSCTNSSMFDLMLSARILLLRNELVRLIKQREQRDNNKAENA